MNSENMAFFLLVFKTTWEIKYLTNVHNCFNYRLHLDESFDITNLSEKLWEFKLSFSIKMSNEICTPFSTQFFISEASVLFLKKKRKVKRSFLTNYVDLKFRIFYSIYQ